MKWWQGALPPKEDFWAFVRLCALCVAFMLVVWGFASVVQLLVDQAKENAQKEAFRKDIVDATITTTEEPTL